MIHYWIKQNVLVKILTPNNGIIKAVILTNKYQE